jgi:hypothetical protein
MDIESFKNAIELGAKALGLAKGIKDLLPNSPEKEAASQTLEEAENAFRIAEAQAAQELDYHLCKCTWPPQITLSIGYGDDGYTEQFKCPECGMIWPGHEPDLPTGLAI